MFKLVDYFENPNGEVIAESESQLELIKKAREFIADTDGECDLEIE